MSAIVGTGWSFPVKPSELGQLRMLSGDAKVRQSIWLILSTAPGERQMLPDFGCEIHDLVFQPNTAALRGLLREKVRDVLVRFEPRIDVVDVSVESDPQTANRLNIAIDYRLRINNAFFNQVYPFFLNEGPTVF